MVEVLLVALIVLVIGLILVTLNRSTSNGSNSLEVVNGINATLQSGKTETLDLLHHLRGEVQQARAESSVLASRMSALDQKVDHANQSLIMARTDLTKTETNTQGIISAAQTLHQELRNARENIARIQAQGQARQEVELRSAEAIRRLEMVIAGSASRGAAGENILENVFSQLPSEWQLRNVQVNGRTCEFGLRLPNQLVLPIDSKWTATQLLDDFIASKDVAEQRRIKSDIEKRVFMKAMEVKKYIEPSMTVNFAVAVVPDAVYEMCSQCVYDAFRHDVVIVSWSMFIPYLLLVFQTILKTSQSLDVEKLDRELRFAEKSVEKLHKEVNGRFSTALTMLSNSRNELSKDLGTLQGSLASLMKSDARSPDVTPDTLLAEAASDLLSLPSEL